MPCDGVTLMVDDPFIVVPGYVHISPGMNRESVAFCGHASLARMQIQFANLCALGGLGVRQGLRLLLCKGVNLTHASARLAASEPAAAPVRPAYWPANSSALFSG